MEQDIAVADSTECELLVHILLHLFNALRCMIFKTYMHGNIDILCQTLCFFSISCCSVKIMMVIFQSCGMLSCFHRHVELP